MSDIQIYDVSGYIHTASHVETFSNKKSRMFPVGGIRFFLRDLITSLRLGDRVVCSFDSKAPSVPKYPGYKGNRTLNPEVVAQCEYLYKFLRKCGIPCYKGFGESDDIIYNIVEQYKGDMGLYKIFVNGSDYDLCHNVDEYCVEYKTCNKNTNCVDWMNFDRAIGWGKEPIIFNTVLAYKVLCGKKADAIKPFTTIDGRTGLSLYKYYKELLLSMDKRFDGSIIRSRKLLEKFLLGTVSNQDDLKTLRKRMDAIYPKDLRNSYSNGFDVADKNDIDLQLLADYCYAIGDRTSLSTLRLLKVSPRPEDRISDILSEIYDWGKDFSSGRWMASKSINLEKSQTFSERVSIKDI